MKNIVDKLKILGLKEQGYSNREVARKTGMNRKTVARYWKAYLAQKEELEKPEIDTKQLQEEITSAPKYSCDNRKKRKLTDGLLKRLDEILEEEKQKDKKLGVHKQGLTKKQIHEKLVLDGYDISLSTINTEINRIRNSTKECFVRQEYEYGDRLEYDFGEVKLEIGGVVRTYHMAVLASPGGKFRWSYLYTNQKKDVFMDSHVRFFEMLGGVYREVVYDNMRNVVTRFIGRNERELNEELVKMSIYYGFRINVTNCFSGNEKGYVESSVKILRNQIFAKNYSFASFEDAQKYLKSQLLTFNSCSQIEEEKKYLLSYKPKLELATISENEVNSYSFIQIDNNFYSVPEYLVGKKVTVKKYFNEIYVFSNNVKVCAHSRLESNGKTQVDIMHYLSTFTKKPGALRNSLALKSIPELKEIFDTYYASKPRKFIEILAQNNDLTIVSLLDFFKEKSRCKAEISAIDVIKTGSMIETATRSQLSDYASLCMKAGGAV